MEPEVKKTLADFKRTTARLNKEVTWSDILSGVDTAGQPGRHLIAIEIQITYT